MRILVADDDPLSLHMVVYRMRQWGYEVVTCSDGNQAWDILQTDQPPNIAILDWMMPGIDGVELCQRIRAQSDGPYVYIILLTGKDNPEDLVTGLDSGADDYLCKPFHLGELEARLRSGKRIIDLQTELIAARETLRVQAMQDPLTQVFNHGAIIDYLLRDLSRAHREHQSLGLILADLDDFKSVNDSFGHLAGDRVLVEATKRMQECLRPYDAIGRYGGEEFLIILPGSDIPTVMQQAERIRSSVSQDPIYYQDHPLTVTVSQGVTTWMPSCPQDVGSLIQVVDGALYLAKNSGRNRVEFAQFEKESVTEALVSSIYADEK